MAPTRAKARYAATTLSFWVKGPIDLWVEGPIDVMAKPPWVHVAIRNNAEKKQPFPAEKVSVAALSLHPHAGIAPATWLKSRENNALKSP